MNFHKKGVLDPSRKIDISINSYSGRNVHGSYEEKLAQIKLETLQARIMRGDMIETFRILHGFEKVDPDKFFNKAGSQHPHRTRLTSVLSSEKVETPSFVKKKHNLELRGNFFSQRAVTPWNNIPAEVRESKSIELFKIAYMEFKPKPSLKSSKPK